MHLMVCIPSARGVHPQTVSCLFNMRTVLEKRNHRLHFSTVYRLPLDLARNELASNVVRTTVDAVLLLDDDVQIEPLHDPKAVLGMLNGIEKGADVVTAPCRLRSHDGGSLVQFNIQPAAIETETIGDIRLLECSRTGLGAVMLRKGVLDKLYADADAQGRTYASYTAKGQGAANLFGSCVAPAREFHPDAPAGANVFILDDHVFSRHVRAAGFKIWAAIDVTTCHDGMIGCFAEELERFERAQKAAEDVDRPGLVGADGKAL